MTTKPTIRIGVVGAGGMGKVHAQAFARIGKIYSLPAEPVLDFVADVSEDIARDAAERFGFARWTTDWRELVADPDINLVDVTTQIICTPSRRSRLRRRASTSTVRSRSERPKRSRAACSRRCTGRASSPMSASTA